MLDIPRNGSLRGDGAESLCRNTLADTQQLEHGSARVPRAYLHMYSTSIISPCSHFPPAYGTSQQDERGDANDGNKLGLVTNNTKKKGG